MKNSFTLGEKELDLFGIVAPDNLMSVYFREASTFVRDENGVALLEILYGFSPKEFDAELGTSLRAPITFKLKENCFDVVYADGIKTSRSYGSCKVIDTTKLSSQPKYFAEACRHLFLEDITNAINTGEKEYITLKISAQPRILINNKPSPDDFHKIESRANYGLGYLACLVSGLKKAHEMKLGIDATGTLHAKFAVPPYHCNYWLAPVQEQS